MTLALAEYYLSATENPKHVVVVMVGKMLDIFSEKRFCTILYII